MLCCRRIRDEMKRTIEQNILFFLIRIFLLGFPLEETTTVIVETVVGVGEFTGKHIKFVH